MLGEALEAENSHKIDDTQGNNNALQKTHNTSL
jgi:hypothetical protein